MFMKKSYIYAYYPNMTSRHNIKVNPIVMPIIPLGPWQFGINSLTQTNIIAPAAKLKK